jgi:hypothetical protein
MFEVEAGAARSFENVRKLQMKLLIHDEEEE